MVRKLNKKLVALIAITNFIFNNNALAFSLQAPAGTWFHWVVYNIPKETKNIPENIKNFPQETFEYFLSRFSTYFKPSAGH